MTDPVAYEYGPDVHEGMLERRVCDQMALWMPWALEIVDGHENTTTPSPRTYQTASDPGDAWIERTPPALTVVCPGTVGEPGRHGPQGTYGAWWQVNVGVSAGGATTKGSRAIAQRHAAAARRVLVQQVAGELVDRVDWKGSNVDPARGRRTVMACEVIAWLFVPAVVDTRGPVPAAPDDPAEYPVVVDRRTRVSVQPTDI